MNIIDGIVSHSSVKNHWTIKASCGLPPGHRVISLANIISNMIPDFIDIFWKGKLKLAASLTIRTHRPDHSRTALRTKRFGVGDYNSAEEAVPFAKPKFSLERCLYQKQVYLLLATQIPQMEALIL